MSGSLTESAAMAVDENVNREDLERFKRAYVEQAKRGEPSTKASFDFAAALSHGTQHECKTAIKMFENLCQREEEDSGKRTYVYYLAVANARIRNYDEALAYVQLLLHHEPTNQQAIGLQALIKERVRRDSMVGAAAVGGGALVVGAIAAGLFAAFRRSK